MAQLFSDRYLKRHIVLPTDHGSWVFILSPLLIGLFAGGRWTTASAYLVIGAMVAFLIRQPVTTAIKVYSKRRSRNDLPSAWFWIGVYSLVALLALAGLITQGYAYLLILALPGIPVFIWHLILVNRRAERRQVGIEVVGSGVLALAAPAAYWVGVAKPDPMGWWLFVLIWFQSAASIVYAYLRLEQRILNEMPPRSLQLQMARRALLYTTFNFVVVLTLSILQILPRFLFLPYAVQWLETLWGASHPAIGAKPTRIGVRQLIVSTLFTILFILTWNIEGA